MYQAANLCLAAALFLSLTSTSFACKGSTRIYSDDFHELDAGWFINQADVESGKVVVGDGRIFVRPDPEKGYAVLNLAFGLPTNADICVKARIVESKDLSKASVGVMFWAKGYKESYLFMVIGNGKYVVQHLIEGAWQNITPLMTARSFKSGLGQDNSLRVVAKDESITLFLNDEQVSKFRAQPPTGFVNAGFRVGSYSKDPTAAEFRDFIVTNVQ